MRMGMSKLGFSTFYWTNIKLIAVGHMTLQKVKRISAYQMNTHKLNIAGIRSIMKPSR